MWLSSLEMSVRVCRLCICLSRFLFLTLNASTNVAWIILYPHRKAMVKLASTNMDQKTRYRLNDFRNSHASGDPASTFGSDLTDKSNFPDAASVEQNDPCIMSRSPVIQSLSRSKFNSLIDRCFRYTSTVMVTLASRTEMRNMLFGEGHVSHVTGNIVPTSHSLVCLNFASAVIFYSATQPVLPQHIQNIKAGVPRYSIFSTSHPAHPR